MGEAAMRHQLRRRTKPERVEEIDIRNTLRQCTPDHGLLAELLIRKQLADDGAKGDVG